MPQSEIMTIQEVAEYVRVSERTIYSWASKGQIPCGKLGLTWRFKRSEIEKWVDSKLMPQASPPTPLANILIKDILSTERVLILQNNHKKEALDELINVFPYKNKDEIKQGIYKREELMSTGIGFGIAIPHVRLESIPKLSMAVGVSHEGIKDYESLDGKPVHIIFMILSSKGQHAQHIKTMATISRTFKNKDLFNSILASNDASVIFKALNNSGD